MRAWFLPFLCFFLPPPSLPSYSLSSCPSLLFLCWQRVYWSKSDGERGSVCVRGGVGAGMCKKCQSKTFTWKAVSRWKASCFTICLYIFFFLSLSLCLSLSPSLLLPWFMPGELMWEQGQPPHVYSRLGGVIESHWGLHDPNTTMTFIQPFASPEVDLEGMWLTIFICLLLLVSSKSCPLLHFHPLVSLVPFTGKSLCSVSLLHNAG